MKNELQWMNIWLFLIWLSSLGNGCSHWTELQQEELIRVNKNLSEINQALKDLKK